MEVRKEGRREGGERKGKRESEMSREGGGEVRVKILMERWQGPITNGS